MDLLSKDGYLIKMNDQIVDISHIKMSVPLKTDVVYKSAHVDWIIRYV